MATAGDRDYGRRQSVGTSLGGTEMGSSGLLGPFVGALGVFCRCCRCLNGGCLGKVGTSGVIVLVLVALTFDEAGGAHM